MRATRSDDERILELLRQRASGRLSGDLAREYGVTPEAIRIPTNRVLAADLKEGGEPEGEVLRAYWNREAGYSRERRGAA